MTLRKIQYLMTFGSFVENISS